MTASAQAVLHPAVAFLDEVDQRIIQQLRRDGRMPFKSLAESLGLTETTVRSRVRRLEESQSMRIAAITDFEAMGYQTMLAVGVQVEGRATEAVARDLARVDEVFSICQVVGQLDIETLAVARDQRHLGELLAQLAAIPGVRKLQPSIALEVLKNQSHWVPFKPANKLQHEPIAEAGTEGGQLRVLDELDRQIVHSLADDARVSNRKIATALGVTEGTVRSRIKRMEAQGQLSITALTNIERLGKPTLAYIWIEAERSDQCEALAKTLAAVPEIGFVGKMLGRFDLLVITLVQNNSELAEFLHRELSGLAGLRRTECSLGVDFVKHDARMSRIIKSDDGFDG